MVKSHESGKGIPVYGEGETRSRLGLAVMNLAWIGVQRGRRKSLHHMPFDFSDGLRRGLFRSRR